MKNKIIYLVFSLFLLCSCSNDTKTHTCTMEGLYGDTEIVIEESNDVVSKESFTFHYNSDYVKDFNFSDIRSAYSYLNEYYEDKVKDLKDPEYEIYYTNSDVVIKLSLNFNLDDIETTYELGLSEKDQVYNDHISYSATKDLFNLTCEDK